MLTETTIKSDCHEVKLVTWSAIDRPGAYVSKESGTLFRIGPETVTSGRSKKIAVVFQEGIEAFVVAHITGNSNISLKSAREICAASGLQYQF